MPFEYRNHTADVHVVASEESFEGALDQCVKAFTGVLSDETIREVSAHPIEVSASTKEELLFELLDELVFLLDTKGFVAFKLDGDVLDLGSQWVLDGVLYGDNVLSYEHSGDIKAPTMQKLSVSESSDGWTCSYVLDL